VIVVDTGVWIDYLRQTDTPQAARLESMLSDGFVIATTGVIRMELLRGASPGLHDALRDSLDELPLLAIEESDFDVAAGLYRACRLAGASVQNSIDCLIAAPCIRAGVPLLCADADFTQLAAVSDVRIVTA
jgi:predicted nucleic acid-binding protein